jgi:peroxiredoxin
MRKSNLLAIGLVLIIPLMALNCSQSGKSAPDRLVAGDTAPLFSLPMLEGNEEVVVAKVFYNAYATVLIFWSMDCPSCREALLECQKVYDEYQNTSTAFYGINYDMENTQGVRAFLKGENVTIPHLWDRGQRTTKEYKALDYTFSVFVVNREGVIVLAQYDHPPDLADILRKAIDKTFPKRSEE